MRRVSMVPKLTAVLALFIIAAAAQDSSNHEREYDYPAADITSALHNLHADATSKLPELNGFIDEKINSSSYERPYYQMLIVAKPKDEEHTLVRVKAKITAWYTDPRTGAQEYREVPSNGRLESDLFDRLDAYLKKTNADLTGRIEGLESRLAASRAQLQNLQKRRDELIAANKPLEEALAAQQTSAKLVVVKAAAPVVAAPAASSSVLLKAQQEDVFEVVAQRGAWTQVKLASNQQGWIPSAQLNPVQETTQAALSLAPAETDPEFAVTREDVTMFLGDWAGLKGKKALFIYAQPLGVRQGANLGQEKLSYVKHLFADRYRQAVHSDAAFSGVVIIFMGAQGGVAAAKLDDIRQWLDGNIPDAAFLKRCSLDPPQMFEALKQTGQISTAPQKP